MDRHPATIQTIADAREFALSTVCDYQFGGTASAEGFAKWIYANRNVMDFNNYDNDLAEYLVSEGENLHEYNLPQSAIMHGWFESHTPLNENSKTRSWRPDDKDMFEYIYRSSDYKKRSNKYFASFAKLGWVRSCYDIIQYGDQWFACNKNHAYHLKIMFDAGYYYIPALPYKIIGPKNKKSFGTIYIKIDSNGKFLCLSKFLVETRLKNPIYFINKF